MERTPAVSGLFYPAEAGALRRTLERCLDEPGGAVLKPLAVLVPHAGYAYSGATAGKVYGRITIPDGVVLLGPNHTGRGRPAAVWPAGSWRTPLGDVPVDAAVAAELVAAHPLLEADGEAHLLEHALEVQLPFLLARRPQVRIVPVTLADCGLDHLLSMGQALAGVMAARNEGWMVVISSDMTHFQSREQARQQDQLALDRLQALDPAGLYQVVREHAVSMCGVVPAVVGLAAAVEMGARQCTLVDYSCSGDTTGDDSDVVAYAGMTIV
jgi:AmmeMemoRadiSam system protein B